MRTIIKKVLKIFLPYGAVILYRKYKDYKKKYKNKNKEYAFDVIFSVGIACRPAHYLKKYGIRLCANPLDWMMSYSLDTVIHLYQTNFADFFTDFVEDKQKTHWFVDIKNNINALF